MSPRIALLLAALAAGPASAQEMTSARIAANQDWSLFRSGPGTCFTVSGPRDQAASRDGSPVQVQRGPAQLAVLYGPESGGTGQVSFVGGYAFASGSTVTLDIGGTRYTLFTEGDIAFAASPQEDARVVAALRGGSAAVVQGVSGRGTITRDTFSLLGFSAMVEAAARCAG